VIARLAELAEIPLLNAIEAALPGMPGVSGVRRPTSGPPIARPPGLFRQFSFALINQAYSALPSFCSSRSARACSWSSLAWAHRTSAWIIVAKPRAKYR